jgi:multiple sugar transport system substrate-binding protein
MTEVKDALGRAISRRGFLGTTALAAMGVAGAGVLAGCAGGKGAGPGGGTGGGGSGAGGGGPVTWASWANPGEGERFKQFSKDYTSQYGVQVTWQQVVGDYQSKLLTQLAGGAAPDAFYVGDTSMAPLIASGKLEKLDDFVASADSPIKVSEVYEGLYQWCKDKEGALYGVPVDCNPKVFWFNKGLLAEAGVAADPVAAFTGGTWNRDALDDLLTKVKGTGKRGMVVESNWFDLFSLITTFGGTAVDDSGKAVFDTDPKAMETITWLFDHFKNETITYGGTLPKGQGVDALFYGGQLATVQYGRWILPNLKKLKNLEYDIAPMPSEDGKTIFPAAVYTAAMSVQTGAKDKQAALMFFGRFVNKDGQKARLSGGGNAVPSMAGLDDVVTEGGLPANAKYFTECAAKGYAVPEVIARSAKVGTNFGTQMDSLIKGGASAQDFATKMAAFINAGG